MSYADDVNFNRAIPFTLIQECPFPNDWSNVRNFSNDPHDPGGATMCGIIQSEYNQYRARKGEPLRSVHLLTKEEGYDIYYNEYWLPHCPTLPAGLGLSFFDEAVNGGPVAAVRLLQASLGAGVDGIWGPQTMAKVQALQAKPEIQQTIKNFTARRAAWYRSLSGYRYFGVDWERRTAEIGAQSLTLAA